MNSHISRCKTRKGPNESQVGRPRFLDHWHLARNQSLQLRRWHDGRAGLGRIPVKTSGSVQAGDALLDDVQRAAIRERAQAVQQLMQHFGLARCVIQEVQGRPQFRVRSDHWMRGCDERRGNWGNWHGGHQLLSQCIVGLKAAEAFLPGHHHLFQKRLMALVEPGQEDLLQRVRRLRHVGLIRRVGNYDNGIGPSSGSRCLIG